MPDYMTVLTEHQAVKSLSLTLTVTCCKHVEQFGFINNFQHSDTFAWADDHTKKRKKFLHLVTKQQNVNEEPVQNPACPGLPGKWLLTCGGGVVAIGKNRFLPQLLP